jgi:hypothetical protein
MAEGSCLLQLSATVTEHDKSGVRCTKIGKITNGKVFVYRHLCATPPCASTGDNLVIDISYAHTVEDLMPKYVFQDASDDILAHIGPETKTQRCKWPHETVSDVL